MRLAFGSACAPLGPLQVRPHTALVSVRTLSSDVCPYTHSLMSVHIRVSIMCRHELRTGGQGAGCLHGCRGGVPSRLALPAAGGLPAAAPRHLRCMHAAWLFPRSVAHAALHACRWAARCCPCPCPSAPTIYRSVLLLPCHDSRLHSAALQDRRVCWLSTSML